MSGVVVATTKVRIFKQITTLRVQRYAQTKLLLLPQRYVFSSKSQLFLDSITRLARCCCYHKGTYFQANHNLKFSYLNSLTVVVATTKVRIFKQITTRMKDYLEDYRLLLLPQRYVFSSKSQRIGVASVKAACCCCYHKGTYFQANHNVVQ